MPHHDPIDIEHAATPGLLRRLAAIGYDSLLLAALYVLVSALVVLPAGMLFGVPEPAGDALVRLLLQLLLILVTLGFFVGFWLHGGQTLGMRAWRIRVVRADGHPLHAGNALLRALGALLSLAPLGLGFLWMLVDRERLTWHDRISATRLVLLRKPERN
jgi:uncharacterized RDD family membrane protein YckC